jgi:hypothetical protein
MSSIIARQPMSADTPSDLFERLEARAHFGGDTLPDLHRIIGLSSVDNGDEI